MIDKHSITQPYYSNCFFEALKAKIKNFKEIHFIIIPPKYNEVFCWHFMWTDGKYDYDFGTPEWLDWYEVFWFKGTIRQMKLGQAKKYLAYKKHLYYQNKQKVRDAIKFFKEEDAKIKLHQKAEEINKKYPNEQRFGEKEVRWELP